MSSSSADQMAAIRRHRSDGDTYCPGGWLSVDRVEILLATGFLSPLHADDGPEQWRAMMRLVDYVGREL